MWIIPVIIGLIFLGLIAIVLFLVVFMILRRVAIYLFLKLKSLVRNHA